MLDTLKGDVSSTLDLARSASVDHLVIGGIKSLETDAFIVSDELLSPNWALKDEGEYVRVGLPEARVLAAVPTDGGISPADLRSRGCGRTRWAGALHESAAGSPTRRRTSCSARCKATRKIPWPCSCATSRLRAARSMR